MAVFIEQKSGFPKIYAQHLSDVILSTDDLSKLLLKMVNPVHEELQLQCNNPIEDISIYNIVGQKMFSYHPSGLMEFAVATQNWISGWYMVQVTTTHGKTKTLKVWKE